jgi:transcription factor TFIIIB component B''
VFAPKFPQRRPNAPSSAQSSARPSVERQSQTPAPHPHPHTAETTTIPGDDDTSDRTNEPSRAAAHTPLEPLLETSTDALPHAVPPVGAPSPNTSAQTQKAVLPPDKESLKRKTRGRDAEIKGPSKRHQSSSLDVPKSPSHPASVKQAQTSESQYQSAETQTTSVPPSESADAETQPLDPPQTPQTLSPAIGAAATETTTNLEPSQATTHDPIAASSPRHPLPDSTQDNSDRESGHEVTTNGLGPAGDVGSGAEGRQLAQTPVIVPMAPLNPDGTPGEPVQQPATGTKKKVPKRRKVQEAEDGGDVRATVEMQLNRPRRAPGKKSARKRKDEGKKKGKRAETPEGAEKEEINAEEIKMAELCKDLRIGQKFSKHDELRQREKQKLIRAQLANIAPELAEGEEAADGQPQNIEQPVSGSGPKMKLVGGQIVMDESSMLLDRQKQAEAERGDVEEVVENEFSKITTSGTHMKRERAQMWDMAANEIFWKGLRMFGTDFEMISKMFPHRNRRQIKLKFNKEEKDNPAKIDRILKGAGSSIELDTYEELSGVKLEEVAAIDAERERIEAEHNAEEERRKAEHAEAERKKKEAIDAQRDAVRRTLGTADDDGGSGEKENQPGSRQSLGPENQKTQVLAKKARGKKDGAARKQKKQIAVDETVQVLGNA